jgi:hypothetical protein
MIAQTHPVLSILSYACPVCGLRYQNQGLTPKEERARYALHHNEPTPAYVAMFESILETIEPFLQGTLLDFGCGEYCVLEQLLTKRYAITSYDLFFHPVPLQTYDTVIAIEVVEHFLDPAREWAKLLSLVRPHGTLIVQTRFVDPPFFEWWYQRDPTHRTFYTSHALEQLAQGAGFEVVFSNNHSIMILKRGP